MWTDNETDIDFLNFSDVAKTATEVIRQGSAKAGIDRNIGCLGVGKSSMIKLIRNELPNNSELARPISISIRFVPLP
jgi:hypothetical protein